MVTVTNECSGTYFPQDTDFAASVVRDKYCVCFASRLVDLVTTDKLIANELSGGLTPFHCPVRAKHAAISMLGFKPRAAAFAFVEVLAGVRRHYLDGRLATPGIGDDRL